MVVGESRSDLLEWLNSTLELNYLRIEECGKGSAFCQLMDCIYGGVPVGKVKFNASTEYDYRQNWKILQAAFTKHNITKVIDVERLIKCRLQDNLELLQWFKRQWTDNKGNIDAYDAKARRKGAPGAATPAPSSGSAGRVPARSRTPSTTSTSNPTSRRSTLSHSPKLAANAANTPQPRRVSSGTSSRSSITPQSSQNSSKVIQLNKELNDALSEVGQLNEEIQEYRLSAETLETERNFYFNKLREIEILVQNINDLVETNNFAQLKELAVVDLTKKIQTILYSTEEGFQATPVEDDDDVHDAGQNSDLHLYSEMDADLVTGEHIDQQIDDESF